VAEDELTPPTVVEEAPDPEAALATFIAQELEHRGFAVRHDGAAVDVETPRRRFKVTVE
jgi:hypothetical protein